MVTPRRKKQGTTHLQKGGVYAELKELIQENSTQNS